jgi:hypothetical protein
LEWRPACIRRSATGAVLAAAVALLAAPIALMAGAPGTGLITPRDYDVPAPARSFSTTTFDGGTRDVRLGDYPAVPASAKVEAPRRPAAGVRGEPVRSEAGRAEPSRPEPARIAPNEGDRELSRFDAALRDGAAPPFPQDTTLPVVPPAPDGAATSGDGSNPGSPDAADLSPEETSAGPTTLDVPFGDAGLAVAPRAPGAWRKQVLPAGLLYRSYLAGEKESRFAVQTLHETGRGMIWEVVLGGRVGIWRYGTEGVFGAEGWQMDIEGATLLRLDLEQAQDVDAADFRFGVPFSYRRGPLAYKFGYYHISSHTGDEYLVKHPGYERVNYVRESFLFGASYDLNQDWRVYGEIAYAWHASGGAKPLELQFGAEYSPLHPFADRGHAPFAAVNIHLREDFGMGGSVNAEAGWQWRGAQTNHLFRIGLQYFNGKSMQYSFFDRSEQLIGVGMWFDN